MSTRKTSILYQTPRFYAWDAKQAIAVNEDIFSSISDYLSKEGTEKTAQPYLVIGEAGSGKTYLLKRLLNAIEKDNRLALFPVLMDAKAMFSMISSRGRFTMLVGLFCLLIISSIISSERMTPGITI